LLHQYLINLPIFPRASHICLQIDLHSVFVHMLLQLSPFVHILLLLCSKYLLIINIKDFSVFILVWGGGLFNEKSQFTCLRLLLFLFCIMQVLFPYSELDTINFSVVPFLTSSPSVLFITSFMQLNYSPYLLLNLIKLM
jgi:hypothetical protein